MSSLSAIASELFQLPAMSAMVTNNDCRRYRPSIPNTHTLSSLVTIIIITMADHHYTSTTTNNNAHDDKNPNDTVKNEDMHQQLEASGLGMPDTQEWNSSSNSLWSPLLHGDRWGHAAVVVPVQADDDNNQPPRHPQPQPPPPYEAIVVVGGGGTHRPCGIHSVLVYHPITQIWHTGPPLKQKRRFLCAETCHGYVFAMAGLWSYTMERIAISDLLLRSSVSPPLESTTTTTRTENHNGDHSHQDQPQHDNGNHDDTGGGWTLLNCRLTEQRWDAASAVIHDRFLILVGGNTTSSMDIVDTWLSSSQLVVVVPGPSMTIPRRSFGAAVVRHSNTPWVVGGRQCSPIVQNVQSLESIEFASLERLMEYEEQNKNMSSLSLSSSSGPTTRMRSTASLLFTTDATCGTTTPNTTTWTLHDDDWTLTTPCRSHCVTAVRGTACLVVVGGTTHPLRHCANHHHSHHSGGTHNDSLTTTRTTPATATTTTTSDTFVMPSSLSTVQVVDTQRRVVYPIVALQHPRRWTAVVQVGHPPAPNRSSRDNPHTTHHLTNHTTTLVVLGGYQQETVETLTLYDARLRKFQWLRDHSSAVVSGIQTTTRKKVDEKSRIY